MTDERTQGDQFPKVFQNPPDGLDGDWTHGVLLVGVRQFQSMEWLEAARVYSATALHLIDRALANGVEWGEAHPALFMCRHSLELYLKAAIPDWGTPKRGNGHDLAPLIDRLKAHLSVRYHAADVERLTSFLREFSEFDPKAMVFRFPDGGLRSVEDSGMDYEVWVDFRALKTTIRSVFTALDHVCLNNMGRNGHHS